MVLLKVSKHCCNTFKKDLLFNDLLHYTKLSVDQLKGFSSLLLAYWQKEKWLFCHTNHKSNKKQKCVNSRFQLDGEESALLHL